MLEWSIFLPCQVERQVSSVFSNPICQWHVIFTQPSLIPATANETKCNYLILYVILRPIRGHPVHFLRDLFISRFLHSLGRTHSTSMWVQKDFASEEGSSPLLFPFMFPAGISTSIQVRAWVTKALCCIYWIGTWGLCSSCGCLRFLDRIAF